MPFVERAGQRRVIEPRRLASELDALQVEFRAGVRTVGVEHTQRERVERGEESDLRPFAQRMAERQGAVRGQFRQQPIGNRAQTFVVLQFGRGGLRGIGRAPAFDVVRDDRCRILADLDCRFRLRLDRQLVLLPNVAALDPQRAVGGDADEGACAPDLVGVEY